LLTISKIKEIYGEKSDNEEFSSVLDSFDNDLNELSNLVYI